MSGTVLTVAFDETLDTGWASPPLSPQPTNLPAVADAGDDVRAGAGATAHVCRRCAAKVVRRALFLAVFCSAAVLTLPGAAAANVQPTVTVRVGLSGTVHRVPLLPRASHPHREGLVRVINRSAEAGEVSIAAFDDAGMEYGPLRLRIGAKEAVHFNSYDLEAGNPDKGLESGIGEGEGAWRLELTSALDLEVLAYVRTPGGALASVHDVVPEDEGVHRVVFVNPASNRNQVSRLRLINPGEEAAAVRISGIDDAGEAGESAVALTLAPRASRTLSAQALESGEGAGQSGALGDGAGKWRLRVTADRPIRVMSLLESATGHLTNLSSVQVTEPKLPPQGGPDLVVSSPSASDTRPAAGTSFILSATVRNDGDVDSAATILRYYRSSDATTTTSDTEVGTAVVAGLTASGSVSESVSLSAPPAPGMFHYGACVDTVAGESDTADNCSSSVQVEVLETQQQQPGEPNLVVEAPSVSTAAPAASAYFTLSASVRNNGTGRSPAHKARFLRSTDRVIEPSDTFVASGRVAVLSAAGRISESVNVMAPSTPGTWYYGACVAAVREERDPTDNCSPPVQVDVEGRSPQSPGGPKLRVLAVSVSAISGNVNPGESFTLSTQVFNDGDAVAAATLLRWYRSADAVITKSDTSVGTDAVGRLDALESTDESAEVTAPAAPGTYYYGACVDPVAGELDTTDNCSRSVAVSVVNTSGSGPDLVVQHPYVAPYSSLDGRQSFIFGATVRNQGDRDSLTNPTLRYYRSVDATISVGDTEVGTDSVDPLAVSDTGDEAITLTAPYFSGTYYYGACVSSVPGETDTSNNCSSAVAVTVQGETPPQSDLLVQPPFAAPTSLLAGQSFTLGTTVRNNGSGDATSTTLRYFRSADSTIGTSDTEVGTDAVAALRAFLNSGSKSLNLTAPSSPGTYYYGACVDSVSGESSTTNNCSSGVAVTVRSAPASSPGTNGAFALDISGCSEGDHSIGLVVDKASEVEALNAARQACLDSGGRPKLCTPHSFQQCLVIGLGVGGRIGCTLGPNEAATIAEAEATRLSRCRESFTNCTIVASACNSQDDGS